MHVLRNRGLARQQIGYCYRNFRAFKLANNLSLGRETVNIILEVDTAVEEVIEKSMNKSTNPAGNTRC
jgi:hypothetical protein